MRSTPRAMRCRCWRPAARRSRTCRSPRMRRAGTIPAGRAACAWDRTCWPFRRAASAHPESHGRQGPDGRLRGDAGGDARSPRPRRRASCAPALEVSALQAVSRDFAFVLDDGVPAEKVLRAAAKGADKALIADVAVFDVYQGDRPRRRQEVGRHRRHPAADARHADRRRDRRGLGQRWSPRSPNHRRRPARLSPPARASGFVKDGWKDRLPNCICS